MAQQDIVDPKMIVSNALWTSPNQFKHLLPWLLFLLILWKGGREHFFYFP